MSEVGNIENVKKDSDCLNKLLIENDKLKNNNKELLKQNQKYEEDILEIESKLLDLEQKFYILNKGYIKDPFYLKLIDFCFPLESKRRVYTKKIVKCLTPKLLLYKLINISFPEGTRRREFIRKIRNR